MLRVKFSIILLLMLLLRALSPAIGVSQAAVPGGVWVLKIDDAIGPATSNYVITTLEQAHASLAALVVLEIDTPGGLDTSMREIIQAILDSSIPVVSYVYPQGARAASAGTYIMYASHIAAMAPGTSLGAASPVEIGIPVSPPAIPGAEPEQQAASPASTMERKIMNDAAAYIRALADLHQRNAIWAESAVLEAATLSANEALQENVINFVSTDLSDLLQQLHGYEIQLQRQAHLLQTMGLAVEYHEPDWHTEFLQVITNPNLIIILGMIGIYGIIIEFYNPGLGIPGVLGAICLLLAGYGLQLLPINYAGLGLVILGLALMVAEAFMPSFGVFGLGGVTAFVVGSIMLVDTEVDIFRVSLPVVAAIAITTALTLVIIIRMFLRISKQNAVSGLQAMVGITGHTTAAFDNRGQVMVQGELWQAVSDSHLEKNEEIEVVSVDGLQLHVKKRR